MRLQERGNQRDSVVLEEQGLALFARVLAAVLGPRTSSHAGHLRTLGAYFHGSFYIYITPSSSCPPRGPLGLIPHSSGRV
jgi:hypothetical protein